MVRRYIAHRIFARKAESLYRHLVYSGAATQELTSVNLAAVFKAVYAPLHKGFD